MESATTAREEPIPGEGVRFVQPVRTDFGQEVGSDEIDWWVNKRETDPALLQVRTKEALEAARRLKSEAAKLKGFEPRTYEDLLIRLRTFVEENRAEVAVVYQYARWLYDRDPLAPVILFTYRVWGSTRLSDRMISLNEFAASPQDDQSLAVLALIVLGLFTDSAAR